LPSSTGAKSLPPTPARLSEASLFVSRRRCR
jgi:hypothetical protein